MNTRRGKEGKEERMGELRDASRKGKGEEGGKGRTAWAWV